MDLVPICVLCYSVHTNFFHLSMVSVDKSLQLCLNIPASLWSSCPTLLWYFDLPNLLQRLYVVHSYCLAIFLETVSTSVLILLLHFLASVRIQLSAPQNNYLGQKITLYNLSFLATCIYSIFLFNSASNYLLPKFYIQLLYFLLFLLFFTFA